MNIIRNAVRKTLREYFAHSAGVMGFDYNVTVTARHSDGEVFATREIHNLIMDAGEDEAAKLLCGVAADAFTYIAIGSDDTAAADSQTALVSEISTNGGTRAQDASPSVTANVATISHQFSISGTLAVKEAGLFNAASIGDMFARQVFAVINLTNGDTITVSWEITAGVSR